MIVDRVQVCQMGVEYGVRIILNLILIKMIKTFLTGVSLALRSKPFQSRSLFPTLRNFCSSSKDLTASPLTPAEEIKISSASVGDEQVQVVKTSGAISIMDRIPGVKAESGQLYVLSFTCTKCETKSIRSFTKHAYHKGVVLVRCGGCENIHLVADNIGWFEDTPVNVETMHAGKVKRVQDPIVIGKFLETAFQDELKKQAL